ncbi:hypothetical protein NKI48_25445 [Mesorhizobium sp. M0644]|uniref:hypothetical protein n=1 Tax=Mesorhizobium sp. M0644 TaxID=2956979 RepID=UPI003338A7E4
MPQGVSRIRGVEFNRKSRVDRASRTEIAKFPIREFAKRNWAIDTRPYDQNDPDVVADINGKDAGELLIL